MEDGKANRARDLLAVGHDECVIFFLPGDAGLFKRVGQNPCELAAGIHQQFRDFNRLLSVNVVCHFASRENVPIRFFMLVIYHVPAAFTTF